MYSFSSPDYVVECIEVKSGDTIVVEDRVGTRKTVRLRGVDAPEKGQPYYRAATEAARSAVEGKRVEIDVVSEDRSGDLVGRVRADRRRLGPLLVRSGHAWHDCRQVPKATALAARQREARRSRRGLWTREDPVPPWEHQGRGSGLSSTVRQLVQRVAAVVRGRSTRDGPAMSID